MEGALRATLRRLSSAEWILEVECHIDSSAREAAQNDDRRGIAPFFVSGTRHEAIVPIEILLDAPGLLVDSTLPQLADQVAIGARRTWEIRLLGIPRDGQSVWVSLYSVGRFVQAVQAEPDQ
jgi:hypothetical protein